jgi:hypothetical protein
MYTVRDVNTGEFLFLEPESERLLFTHSSCTVKDDYEDMHQLIEWATKEYPENLTGRTIGIYDVGMSFSPSAVYHL